jgi:hypothetical protein
MIGRLLRTGTTLFFLFCVATLLAQAMLVAYYWATWGMNGEKVLQMLAIAQGVDLFAAQKDAQAGQDEVPPEEPSYQDWVDRRATMFRDVELREQALANAVARLRSEQQQLADDRKTSDRVEKAFEARLASLKEGAEAQGREAVGRILESIKPKQAKDQIIEMLDNNENNEVVLLLNAMSSSKLSKVLAEFKTPEENEKIGEVLRLIREGQPLTSMVDQALGETKPGDITGS